MLSRLFWIMTGFISGWLLHPRPGPDAPDRVMDMDDANEPLDSPVDDETAAEVLDADTGEPLDLELAGPLMDELRQLRDALAGVQTGLAALDKQWSRAGREQLKANTLAEAQQQQTQAALEQLREQSARRESDLAALRDQLQSDQSAQRLRVIEWILPALDGLDEALASGARLLERAAQSAPPPAPLVAPPTLSARQRLAIVVGRVDWSTFMSVPARGAEPAQADAWRPLIEAWLRGLELVRARLLDTLASEGVRPIAALGEPFDPHHHIVIETVSAAGDVAPGTIVAEHRRGYAHGERVLRLAEVAAAQVGQNPITREAGRDNHE